MAVQCQGVLRCNVFRRPLPSFHKANSTYTRSTEAPPNYGRTHEANIRQHRVIAPGRGSTGLELRQRLECGRPTAPGADELQLALQHKCVKAQPQAQWSRRSAGWSVRLITVRSVVHAYVGQVCLNEMCVSSLAKSNALELPKQIVWMLRPMLARANLPWQDSNLQSQAP